MGIWFITEHSAFCPQVPGQGSTHLFLMQALSLGQSELSTHSGLQPDRDLLGIRADKYKHHYYIVRSDHKVKDCKDRLELVLVL
jgi:hypothetical protein